MAREFGSTGIEDQAYGVLTEAEEKFGALIPLDQRIGEWDTEAASSVFDPLAMRVQLETYIETEFAVGREREPAVSVADQSSVPNGQLKILLESSESGQASDVDPDDIAKLHGIDLQQTMFADELGH